MEESTSKEKVLKNIRNALIDKKEGFSDKVDMDSPIYITAEESSDVTFAQEFTKVAGKFVYCENEDEFTAALKGVMKENNWDQLYCLDKQIIDSLKTRDIKIEEAPEEFNKLKAGLTSCEYLIARLGSVMISSRNAGGRRLNVFPEVHLVKAYTTQLVPDLKDAFKALKEKYKNNLPSMISCITGPSRTADIEKTLVMGAHGPKELFVFLIEDRN